MVIKLTISTLPEPDIPIAGAFSLVVTVGGRISIDVLQTNAPASGSAASLVTPASTARRRTSWSASKSSARSCIGTSAGSSPSSSFALDPPPSSTTMPIAIPSAMPIALFYYNAHRDPPVGLEPLVERLLKRPMTKGQNMDAVTTALRGDRVGLGNLAGN